jgi:hypothetical protein
MIVCVFGDQLLDAANEVAILSICCVVIKLFKRESNTKSAAILRQKYHQQDCISKSMAETSLLHVFDREKHASRTLRLTRSQIAHGMLCSLQWLYGRQIFRREAISNIVNQRQNISKSSP